MISTYNKKFASHGIPNTDFTDHIHKLLDAFVDNADLWDIVCNPTIFPDTLLSRLKECAQFWQDILFAIGGKLNSSKYFWYLLLWSWDVDGQATLISQTSEAPWQMQVAGGNWDVSNQSEVWSSLLTSAGNIYDHVDAFDNDSSIPRNLKSQKNVSLTFIQIPIEFYGNNNPNNTIA